MKAGKWVSIGLGFLVLALGATAMAALMTGNKNPDQMDNPSGVSLLRVEAVSVSPAKVETTIRGYGEVRARRTVELAPEVSGKVTKVHPQLVNGGVVEEGDVLFAVERASYELKRAEAEAEMHKWETTLERLQREYEEENARKPLLERTRELAQANFRRTQELLTENVGNQSDVDDAERLLNQAADAVRQLERDLSLYPHRIKESRHNLEIAKAQRDMADLDLTKTLVRAPFSGRVTSYSVELGHMAMQGQRAVKLSDDSYLEIPVELDAGEARRWLRFSDNAHHNGSAWFAKPVPLECKIRWTEEPDGPIWRGHVHRVEAFDSDSRTVTLTIRVKGEDAFLEEHNGFPLVAGMFCEIAIPGRTMENVYPLPQWTVNVDDNVYLANDGRLRTRQVRVARSEGGTVYVSDGLEPGDLVITTRLINPLENTPLEVVTDRGLVPESHGAGTKE